jgi:hypothetical protein
VVSHFDVLTFINDSNFHFIQDELQESDNELECLMAAVVVS